MQLTDYELVNECVNGNKECFAELVTRYKTMIYNVVFYYMKDAEEANDISQEVFIKIYKSLVTYNPQYKFSTWSVRITKNLCLDIIRKKKINLTPIDEIENLSRETDTPESKFIAREKSNVIRQAINDLPEKYRKLIILYHDKGLAYKEIADIIKEPVTIVKNRLYRARLTLRESLACSNYSF